MPVRTPVLILTPAPPDPLRARPQVWLPSLGSVQGAAEERLMAVATTQLLTGAPALQAPAAGEAWGKLLAALVAYVGGAAASAGGWAGDRRAGGHALAARGLLGTGSFPSRLLPLAAPATKPARRAGEGQGSGCRE